MTQKHILSLLVSAALLCGLLAGCSNTNSDASHASSSASEPSGTVVVAPRTGSVD